MVKTTHLYLMRHQIRNDYKIILTQKFLNIKKGFEPINKQIMQFHQVVIFLLRITFIIVLTNVCIFLKKTKQANTL